MCTTMPPIMLSWLKERTANDNRTVMDRLVVDDEASMIHEYNLEDEEA